MSDISTVTIVIPAYNHARHLDMAVQSVLNQDYANIELIVLDDGSTDETSDVLKRYSGKFHWERHANMGQAATLNKGWRMASGEILSYLSADDVLTKTAVSTSLRYLDKFPDVVLAYGDFYLIDGQSSIIRRVNAPEFDYMKMVVEQACPPGPGVFFRKQAFLAAGSWDKSFKQIPDYEYWLRLGRVGKFKRIPIALASFRVHPQSLTFSKADLSRAEEPIIAMEKYFKSNYIPDHLYHRKNESMSNAYIMTAQLNLRSGRYKLGCRYLKIAFHLYRKNFNKKANLRRILNGILNRPIYKIIFLYNKIYNFVLNK